MSKTLILITSLIISVKSFAFDDFCFAPEKTLCNRPEDSQKEREFQKLAEEIATEAQEKAAIRAKTELPTSGPLLGLRKNIKLKKLTNYEIIYAAEKKLGHFEKDIVTTENVNHIKKYLNQSIDESNLSDKFKEKFKKILNEKIIVGNYIDFMERTKVTSSYFKQLWRAHCGMNGMEVNAFAARVDGEKYVLVCPGLLVKLNSLKNSQELTNEIFFVLGHEMAHHFDSGKFHKAYENLAACYQEDLAKKLYKRNGKLCPLDDTICKNKLAERTAKTQKDCQERGSEIATNACLFLQGKINELYFTRCQKGTGEECLKSVTWGHLGEISADYWATKAMGYYLKDRNFSQDEGIEFLRVNFEVLCGSGDEGIHADSDVRGNYMIGTNPMIRDQLTCEPATKKYCEI